MELEQPPSDCLMLIYLLEIKIVLNLKLTSSRRRQDLEATKRRLTKIFGSGNHHSGSNIQAIIKGSSSSLHTSTSPQFHNRLQSKDEVFGMLIIIFKSLEI